jgi:hypothetical protein
LTPLEYEKQDLHPTALLQVVDFVVEGEGVFGHLGEAHSRRVDYLENHLGQRQHQDNTPKEF